MSNLQIGVIGTSLLFVAMWVISTEIRLRQTQSKLLEVENEKIDSQIHEKVRQMLTSDLNAELRDDLQGRDTNQPST
jgi:hypothetical protein